MEGVDLVPMRRISVLSLLSLGKSTRISCQNNVRLDLKLDIEFTVDMAKGAEVGDKEKWFQDQALGHEFFSFTNLVLHASCPSLLTTVGNA